MSQDLHQIITDRILALLETGVAPWRSPVIGGSSMYPRNLDSGKHYRGINVFLLACTAHERGYASPWWLTFNQAKANGGSVRKGEKSTMVVFWKMYETKDKETGEPVKLPVLRHYCVFNARQCDGLTIPGEPETPVPPFVPVEAAAAIAAGFKDGPAVHHDGQRAYYRPKADSVHMPEPTRFVSAEEYHSTLFHELAHATGHASRLSRNMITDPQPFGSSDYGREELVAETAAAFLCGHAGISPAVVENQAAYLAGWMKAIRADKRLLVTASAAGQKAADWVRNIRPQQDADE